MPIIDLNADVGEECGDDATLLDVVTSANVAAGGHAGGDEVLRATVEQCARRDVAVGAHPSYPDRANFGRLSMKGEYDVTHLTEVLRHQIRAVATACSAAGPHSLTSKPTERLPRCRHRRCHRRILHRCSHEGFHRNRSRSVRHRGSGVAPAGRAEASTIRFVAEAFVDRAYNADGTLVPRSWLEPCTRTYRWRCHRL